MNYRKYWNLPFCFSKDFFSELKRNLGRNAVLHVSRKAGFITGVAVELRYNGTSHIPLVGIDHEKCGNDMTYFVLTYYAPIAEAISAGMTRLYFGPGHYLNEDETRLQNDRSLQLAQKPPAHCTPNSEVLVRNSLELEQVQVATPGAADPDNGTSQETRSGHSTKV